MKKTKKQLVNKLAKAVTQKYKYKTRNKLLKRKK